jgi:serine/threonine-protein kinase RsbW
VSVPGGGRGRKRDGAAPPARVASRRPATLRLQIPSETRFLALVREVTKRMAETAGFPEPTTERLALAVDEATTNVIEHAYRGAGDRQIELRMEDRGADFRVELVDTGEMVDPRSVPRVDLERYASERKTGGLGMHLMEKIMDSVTFRRSARRNVCAMVKHKDAPEPN